MYLLQLDIYDCFGAPRVWFWHREHRHKRYVGLTLLRVWYLLVYMYIGQYILTGHCTRVPWQKDLFGFDTWPLWLQIFKLLALFKL